MPTSAASPSLTVCFHLNGKKSCGFSGYGYHVVYEVDAANPTPFVLEREGVNDASYSARLAACLARKSSSEIKELMLPKGYGSSSCALG